ncbi:MAG: DUF1864 family protein [Gammaproteobacteria bacterium]|nr:MAG: DUF1864 family protein [Gammaproteobacteria bacterium]
MRTTPNARAFDDWIRGPFRELNTQLEELYFAQADRADVEQAGADIKARLVAEGREHVQRLLAEGNTDEGFEAAFDLLGNVGLYMGACRRHEITNPDRERNSPLKEASALAMHIGASLGVAPRFATSHLATHNPAIDGDYKSFTSLEAEYVFLEYNTQGVLAYKRAADALVRILPLGISHPVARRLLETAREALEEVVVSNEILFEKLDTERFFYCVRPYYKPYRVGQHVYRGANAGDFAGINEIDLLLGLCRADNPSYSQLLVDKFLFMMPEDQDRLRDVMRRRSLLDELLAALPDSAGKPWFQRNARAFLDVVAAHGRTAASHHDALVGKFIQAPASELPDERLKNITASGPPLPVLIDALEKLRDLRLAADRDDIPSRHPDLQRLRAALG